VADDWTKDFAEVLRHELNNPLTGILSDAELLLAEMARKKDGKLPYRRAAACRDDTSTGGENARNGENS
jgi:signal transduction histidine kinase